MPVLISDLDMECQLWLKLRLAPMCPWLGTISLGFVEPPNVKVQLSPYNRVRLMRVPVVQTFLRKLFTEDLPGLMVRGMHTHTGEGGWEGYGRYFGKKPAIDLLLFAPHLLSCAPGSSIALSPHS